MCIAKSVFQKLSYHIEFIRQQVILLYRVLYNLIIIHRNNFLYFFTLLG